MLTAKPSDPTSTILPPEPTGPVAGPPGACSGPLAPRGGDSPARPSAPAVAGPGQLQSSALRARCGHCGVRGFLGTVCPECGTDSAEAA
jgi:hypothetical protein